MDSVVAAMVLKEPLRGRYTCMCCFYFINIHDSMMDDTS